jgi:enterochelin esterase-like enzyme
MYLLGWPLLALLALSAVAYPVLTLALWPRVRGSGLLRAATRLAMVAGCQVTAVLLVAVAVNHYGYFYGSWSELPGLADAGTRLGHAAGAAPAVVEAPAAGDATTRSRVAGPPPSGQVRVLPDPGWSSAPQWATRGRVESVTIRGIRSGLTSHAFVYLPPQYFQEEFAHRALPATQVLAGVPGSDLGLLRSLDYPARLLTEIDAHRARPMVLVMMSPSVAPPRDTECTDVPAGPQALTFLAADVPEAIGASYRVQPRGWGAIGFSTGGYCATKLAMVHSETFSAAVTLSGYFRTLQDRSTGDLYGGSAVVRSLNDLEWRLQHLPSPPVSLLVTTSRDEAGPGGYAASRRFLDLASSTGGAMRVDALVAARGGHNFASWTAHLPRSLSWLSLHLPPPARAEGR